MPLGDSITFGLTGNSASTYTTKGGYRSALWRMLQPKYAFDFVGSLRAGINFASPTNEAPGWDLSQEGHPGITAAVMLGNSNGNITNWLPSANPDLVLLIVATNDLGSGASMQKIIANMSQLYTKIFAYPSVKHLYVASILPSRSSRS